MRRPALLAVDGGGSKIDATLLRRDGSVLGAARVAARDYERTGRRRLLASDRCGDPRGRATDAGLVDAGRIRSPTSASSASPARTSRSTIGGSVAGSPAGAGSASTSCATTRSRCLRAGTDRTWGVGIVCGFGTNCAGVAPDGRVFRLPAIGPVSGDWGGGGEIGGGGAVACDPRRRRARGAHQPATERAGALRHADGATGDGGACTRSGSRDDRLAELAPIVFADAAGGRCGRHGDRRPTGRRDRDHGDGGDPQARHARPRPRRGARRRHLPQRVGAVLRPRSPTACTPSPRMRRIVRLTAPPVVGAAMLGLDLLGAGGAAHARTRASLTHRRLDPHTRGRKER